MYKKTLKTIIAILSTVSASCLLMGQASADVREAIYTGNKPIAPYTPGIKLKNGMLFVSGNIPYVNGAIPEYARDGKNDMEDQTKIVMENIKAVLDKAGYTFNDAVKVSVFMTDIKNYGAFNKVYGTYWGEGDIPPAREAIDIGALPGGKPNAEVLVEVSLIAAK